VTAQSRLELTDSRWPEFAAAITEWSHSALKALDLAASLKIDKAEGDRQADAGSLERGPTGSEIKRSR
jgi:hypothetical protein